MRCTDASVYDLYMFACVIKLKFLLIVVPKE